MNDLPEIVRNLAEIIGRVNKTVGTLGEMAKMMHQSQVITAESLSAMNQRISDLEAKI